MLYYVGVIKKNSDLIRATYMNIETFNIELISRTMIYIVMI